MNRRALASDILLGLALIGLVIYLWRRPVKELAKEMEK